MGLHCVAKVYKQNLNDIHISQAITDYIYLSIILHSNTDLHYGLLYMFIVEIVEIP